MGGARVTFVRRTAACAAAVGALLALPVPAHALLTIDWGTPPIVGDFPATTLTGAPVTLRAGAANWSIVDSRVLGGNWNVTVQATRMQTAGGARIMPASSLRLTPPSSVTRNGLLTSLPTILPGPHVLDSGSAVKIVSADGGVALGTFAFTQSNAGGGDLALSVGPDAYAGSYSSTLTYTIGNTP